MNKRKLFYIFSLLIALFSITCKENEGEAIKPDKAKIVSKGLVDGFAAGLTYSDGNLVYNETSAAVFYNQKMILGSDKTIPNHSSVFRVSCKTTLLSNDIEYLDNQEFMNIRKIEDFTTLPESKFVVATSGFDRVGEDASLDAYNSLLCWKMGSENKVQLVCPTTRNNVTSSVSLREKIAKVLKTTEFPEGVTYFKIEGISAIPENKLLFGIREMGKDFSNFSYAISLVSVSYSLRGDSLFLGEDFSLFYEFSPNSYTNLNLPLGLSSIEYDSFNKRLLVLTSFELANENTGAYLWTISLEDLKAKKSLQLVTLSDGNPLKFNHKTEGLAIIDRETIFLIADDDRVIDKDFDGIIRKPHLAAYYFVKFE